MAKSDDAALDAMLKDAMIGTEKEIFGEAFGQEGVTHDETGDRSLEAMGSGLEGQHEPDEEEAEDEKDEGKDKAQSADAEAKAEGETKVEPEAKVDDRPDERGRVPSGVLKAEKERARTAEAERDAVKAQVESLKADFDKRLAESNARVEAILATLKARQPEPKGADPAKPETPPDLYENPTAYADYLKREAMQPVEAIRKEMADMRINMSMETARARHGETFDKAFAAVRGLDPQSPDNRALVQRLIGSPNPGDALVTWHKRNEALRTIGDDPAAYAARIAKEQRDALTADPEFRRQLIAELRGEAEVGENGKPRNTIRLPPSLQRAAGSNGRAPDDLAGFDGSEGAIFNSAFPS